MQYDIELLRPHVQAGDALNHISGKLRHMAFLGNCFFDNSGTILSFEPTECSTNSKMILKTLL